MSKLYSERQYGGRTCLGMNEIVDFGISDFKISGGVCIFKPLLFWGFPSLCITHFSTISCCFDVVNYSGIRPKYGRGTSDVRERYGFDTVLPRD
jgi:hypothetical protein